MQRASFQAFKQLLVYLFHTRFFNDSSCSVFSDTVVYFFDILSGDFLHKNCSADMALAPDHLPVVRVVLPYLRANSAIFAREFLEQVLAFLRYVLLVIVGIY